MAPNTNHDLHDIDTPDTEIPGLHWDSAPSPVRLGPAEPLDDCPDCQGAVQRWARHPAGLGTLDELPLSRNYFTQPLSPRRPGPGPISLAFETIASLKAVSA